MDGEDASVCRADWLGDESPGSGITSVWSFCSCIFRRFFSLVFLNRLSLSSSESTHEGFMPAVRHFSSRHFWQFFLDLRNKESGNARMIDSISTPNLNCNYISIFLFP